MDALCTPLPASNDNIPTLLIWKNLPTWSALFVIVGRRMRHLAQKIWNFHLPLYPNSIRLQIIYSRAALRRTVPDATFHIKHNDGYKSLHYCQRFLTGIFPMRSAYCLQQTQNGIAITNSKGRVTTCGLTRPVPSRATYFRNTTLRGEHHVHFSGQRHGFALH